MSAIKLYECQVGIEVNGTNYNFDHIRSVTLENPERNNLMRGVNAPTSEGLAFKEGMMEPKTISVPVIEMAKEVFDLLRSCFDNQTRLTFFVVDKQGQSFYGKKCLLAQTPMQLTLDDSAESMDCTLEFVTFLIEQNRV